MNWNEVAQRITPYIVKIETPQGYGTGYLCLYNDSMSFCGIATAYHVVSHADQWQEPIRVINQHSNTTAFLKESDRIIFADMGKDSAVILFPTSQLQLPKELIQLRPIDDRLPIGVEVGWLGYPGIVNTLCFFSGSVSAIQQHSYLIDGVAIPGVSGGPVLFSHATEGVQVVGSITAYMRQTGETLPGLSVARDVSHFHAIVSQIKSLDEARKKRAEEAKKEAAPAQETKPEPEASSATAARRAKN